MNITYFLTEVYQWKYNSTYKKMRIGVEVPKYKL